MAPGYQIDGKGTRSARMAVAVIGQFGCGVGFGHAFLTGDHTNMVRFGVMIFILAQIFAHDFLLTRREKHGTDNRDGGEPKG